MQIRAPLTKIEGRPEFLDGPVMDDSRPALPESCKRVICVSNVLPVRLKKTNGKWSGEFDRESNFADGPLLVGLKGMRVKVVYVGVPNVNVPLSDRAKVEELLASMNCHPVFVGAKEASLHFQGVCKSVLWPCFHNIIDCYNDAHIESILGEEGEHYVPRATTPGSAAPEDVHGQWQKSKSWNPLEIDKCWPSHLDMMTQTRRVVVSIYGEGDVVWVHDYHELMLVGMLRRQLPEATMGLFVHTPFASSEVFRCLSKRQDILDSMLQADHVGFHSYEYARHFLSIAHRMLGLKYGARKGGTFGLTTAKGRTVVVSCAHAGLDLTVVSAYLASPAVAHIRAQLSAPPGGGKVVIGIDEVEGLRGIPLKLLGFDRLLTNCPALRGGAVVLRQFGLVLDSRPDDYQRCHDEVVALVRQINQRWGPVVEFSEDPGMDLQTRLALYESADVLLQTSVRWGLCTEPFEFLLAHRGFAAQAAAAGSGHKRGPGVLVVSEFVACARVLAGSLRINPWSADEIARALEQALAMPTAERVARTFRDCRFLETTSVQVWGEDMLRDVIAAGAERLKTEALLGYFSDRDGLVQAAGIARELDLDAFSAAYQRSKSRLMVFDYSGCACLPRPCRGQQQQHRRRLTPLRTLVETTPHDVYLKPGGRPRVWHYEPGGEASQHEGGCLETRDPVLPGTMAALKRLSANPRNQVVVVSMDLKEELEFALKEVADSLWLMAENGFACRAPGSKEWRRIISEQPHGEPAQREEEGDGDWRARVRQIMASYVSRCNASFAFTAPSSVSFNYMLADPELGEQCAVSLKLELEKLVEGRTLVIERQKGALTVRQGGINRGAALSALAGLLAAPPDFIAVFGDDQEDESGFRAALEAKQERTFTCRVGFHDTKSCAEYGLHDPEELTERGRAARRRPRGRSGGPDAQHHV
jgi:trehalose 6-phosphate synthase/phosphatase